MECPRLALPAAGADTVKYEQLCNKGLAMGTRLAQRTANSMFVANKEWAGSSRNRFSLALREAQRPGRRRSAIASCSGCTTSVS